MKLVLANEAQKQQRDAFTYSEWGRKLSLEQYLAREQRLRAHPFTTGATDARVPGSKSAVDGMQTWLLLDEDGSVRSSCETFQMMSVLGGERRGHCYGVASVFTEDALRGRGYATKMMSLLRDSLMQADPLAHSSLLFSDVGEALYERAGYRARAGTDRFLPATAAASPAEPLREKDLQSALARVPIPADPVVVWPTALQLDWHLERERIYCEALGKPRPASIGATVGGSVIFWAAVPGRDLLVVLLMHADRPNDAPALLRAAQSAAAQGQLSRVQLWASSCTGAAGPALTSIPDEPREGYLPMLSGFVEGASADGWRVIPRAVWI